MGGPFGCRGRRPEVLRRSRVGGIGVRLDDGNKRGESRKSALMKSLVLTIMALLAVPAVHAASVKGTLHPTGVVTGAQGQASFALGGSASRGRHGKFKVRARHLPAGK